MNEQDRLYDAKTRWQETRIKQFSYVNYLVLTLALATLGFAVSLVAENDSFRTKQCAWFFGFHLFSLFSFLASIFSGIYCACLRLRDFRNTSKITRLKYSSGGRITLQVRELRSKTKGLGERSWCVLRWQICTFNAGLVSLILAILLWRLGFLLSTLSD